MIRWDSGLASVGTHCAPNETPKTSTNSALFALTPWTMADTYRELTAGGELRQSERPAPKFPYTFEIVDLFGCGWGAPSLDE